MSLQQARLCGKIYKEYQKQEPWRAEILFLYFKEISKQQNES